MLHSFVLQTRRMRLLLAAIFVATFTAFADHSYADENTTKPRILFVTQSAGYRHASVTRSAGELSPAELAMRQLADRTELFHLFPTQDVKADFTKKSLEKFDVVMFYTTGNLPISNETLDYFFNVWLKRRGHGFVGFHSATDTYNDFEPYWDMIGGTFDGHPWNSSEKVTIAVHDTSHPAARPFGDEFVIQDEIYWYKHWQPKKVRVLMSLDMSKTQLKKPKHVPIAWVKLWGAGKVYYSNLGHNASTWSNEQFLQSTESAIRWVLNLDEGDATPNPALSKDEEVKAKQAAG